MQWILLLLLAGPALSKSTAEVFKDIGKGITKEIADAKQPVEEVLVHAGSSQCSNVKKLVGVAYEQIEGEKEPNLDLLSLKFITSQIQITYNISMAAKLIPESHNYDPKDKLYIFVHGFTDDPTKAGFSNISNALLSAGKCNVLALDGSSLIQWLYLRSSTYVEFMARKLGEVLAAMVKGGLNPDDIHIIGHSLGAHISGFAGKTFKNITGQSVGRVTGLDPAGPCFSHVDENERIKGTDGNFVDIIHTDAGVYGLKDAVGQVDYYPNEGSQQPNCLWQTCSHSRAWQYFTESVLSPKSFPAVKCKDWEAFEKGQCENTISYMGYPSVPGTKGKYYLQTGEQEPFGLGTEGTKYVNKDGYLKTISGVLG